MRGARRAGCVLAVASALAAPLLAAPQDRVLLEAEALYTGTGEHYDPGAAMTLFEQAAVAGEPLASFRLALLLHLGSRGLPKDGDRAAELHRHAVAAVTARAAEGDAYAQYLLGTAALIGLGGAADPAAARPLLERAAAGGQVWAMHNLGWMHQTGRGVPEDAAAAVRWYRQAAAAGGAASMADAGRLLLSEEATGAPCDEGLRWLERAAGAGHSGGIAWLGKVLYFGLGRCVRSDPARALPWLERAAAAQERGAAYDLGYALLVGDAGRYDPARAASLLAQAVEQQDVIALDLLAFLRATGVGLGRDLAESRALRERAAALGSDMFRRWMDQLERDPRAKSLFDQGLARLETLAAGGDAAAQGLLALFLYGGYGASAIRDQERALSLARAAAAAGDASAMRTLAHAFEYGRGVQKNIAEALRLWRRCAELGDSFCMMFYGHELVAGENVARDLEAGMGWLLRSAETGNWWAIGDLGRLYDEGRYGIPRDEAKAAFWKRKAAALGNPAARGWLLYHDRVDE